MTTKPQTRKIHSRMSPEQLGAAQRAVTADVEHYQRTGHCGACCRPARICSCTESEPCGCWDLHGGNRERHPEVESLALFEDAGPLRGKRYEMGS